MKGCFFILILFFVEPLFAQKDSIQFSYGVKSLYGRALVHSSSVQNIKGAKPFGVELELAKQSTNFNDWNNTSAYVKRGWAFTYFDFNTNILGKGFVVSRFIEPQYRLTNHLQFLIRASFGIDYLNNPNSSEKNPVNNNYCLYFNPYMHLGGGLSYQLSKHLSLSFSSNFHHISNGNLKQPNKGINWVTNALSFNYYPDNNVLPKFKRVHNQSVNQYRNSFQAGLFVVPSQGYYTKYFAKRNFIIGINAQVNKQIGRTSALTAGADIYFDDFNVDDGRPSIKSKLIAGIHGGHVFLLGKVKFSQQIGYNLYNKIYFLPNFYTRLGLEYQLSKHYSVGANLKANSDNADFFDLRCSYHF